MTESRKRLERAMRRCHEDLALDRVFAVMALAYQHTFQVLTKRPDRMRAYLSDPDVGLSWLSNIYGEHGHRSQTDDQAFQERDAVDWARVGLPNVWLGVSAENQAQADARIPQLLETPAAVRFVSCEPLLGPVYLLDYLDAGVETSGPAGWQSTTSVDWVIVGGESGPGPRPCHVREIEDLVHQCRAARVPVFVKQLGAFPLVPACRQSHWDYGRFVTGRDESKRFSGTAAAYWRLNLVDRKGGDPAEWPEHIRVRKFPEVTA